MKWIAMIFSFILGQLKSSPINPSLIFIQQALEKSRNLVFLGTVSFISALLFSAGIIIAALNAFSQYDQKGSIYFSATFVGGLVLAALSTVSLALVFSKKNWAVPQVTVSEANSQSHKSSPIEDAISMLVNDFIEGRRANRNEQAQPSSAAAPQPQQRTDRYESPDLHGQLHS